MASRKALIVAINDYPDSANDLPSCVEDDEGVTELLQSEPYGFQDVRTFLDGEATIQAVTEGLRWLFGKSSQGEGAQVTPEDRLVFYYSGHGFRTEKDGVLRECLCLYDGFFFDEELSKQTQGLPPGIFTMVLDSCHSGGMDKRFFETLSADGSSAGESVERVRVKTWMPEPAELVKLFAAEDESIPFKPFGCTTIKPRRGSQAGTKRSAGAGAKVKQAKEAAEAQVNGLMITACQADQMASASSSQTEGRSAFTFCLLNAFKKAGNGLPDLDSLSSDTLFEAVSQDLTALQFKQTPALIEPANAPGLRSKSFLALQPISQASTGASPASPEATPPASGKGFQPSATTAQSSSTSQGDQHVNDRQNAYPMSDADEKMLRAVLPAVLPSLLQYRMKDYQTNAVGEASGQGPAADEKFWGQVVAAAITAAPSIYQAVRGKGVQPSSEMASSQNDVVDEKVLRVLPAILPGILQAYRTKGFEPEGSGAVTPQAPEADEKFWGPVVAAAITAAPSIYRAVRGKDAEPAYG